MLSKLSVRNAKRSIKDYIVYLITVIFSFSFLFALGLISYSKEVIELSSIMSNFRYVMFAVNIVIVFIICFLINYTVRFMFTKRSKEFGTYMILGIKKRNISQVFIVENLLLGFMAFLISLPIGFLFSQLFSVVIMNNFQLDHIVTIGFSAKALFLSFIYFVIIYILVLFLAYKRIRKLKIYDLLYYDKQNEKVSNKRFSKIAFVCFLLVGILSLFLFDQNFKYEDPSLGMILLCFCLIIISIYGVCFTLPDLILSTVLKNKNLKYGSDHLFVARTFRSKARTMSVTLGTLTLLIALALVSLNVSSLFKGMFLYQIEQVAPYDISINGEQEELPKFMELIRKNYTVLDSITYDGYKEPSDMFLRTIEQNGGYTWNQGYEKLMRLSDYNTLLKWRGMEPVTLNSDEYLLHSTKELKDKLSIDSLKKITLSNGITLQQKSYVTKKYTYAWGVGYGYVIVVPDDAIQGLEPVTHHLVVDTKEKTTEVFYDELVKVKQPDLCEEAEAGYTICYPLSSVTVRGKEEALYNGFMTITSFICFYIAFIFIAVVGTILAIQQLSDSTKYQYRYRVLFQLGERQEQLYKTVRKQLLIFFIFPLIYPIVISFCTIVSMNQLFKIALSNDMEYLGYYVFNLGIFLVIYMIYFLATYFGFKKNISE